MPWRLTCSILLAALAASFCDPPAAMSLKVFLASLGLALYATLSVVGHAQAKVPHNKAPAQAAAPLRVARDGQAEAQLIEIYRLIGNAQIQLALDKARQLVKDFPTFALAQLVYGDLLSARTRPVNAFGDVPPDLLKANETALAELRSESRLRLKALKERPPPGAVPAEFLLLSPRSKHAIAVDASRSRLYLFENRPGGLTLVADYYISIGKLGLKRRLKATSARRWGCISLPASSIPRH